MPAMLENKHRHYLFSIFFTEIERREEEQQKGEGVEEKKEEDKEVSLDSI